LFYDEPEFIPNKISKASSLQTKFERKGDVIYKTGPEESMKGELYYYQNIPPQFSQYFPKLIGHTRIDDKIQLQLEFISGIPLYYLYKNKLITEKIIHDVVDIVHKFHSISDNRLTDPTEIGQRASVPCSLLTTNSGGGHKERRPPEEFVPMIHGDFGFSNIMLTYNDEYKLIDMRGQMNGILTISGDKYDDYRTLYQSILGNDLILNGDTIDDEYIDSLKTIFLKKCKDMGIERFTELVIPKMYTGQRGSNLE
jgi:hypothetical protein